VAHASDALTMNEFEILVACVRSTLRPMVRPIWTQTYDTSCEKNSLRVYPRFHATTGNKQEQTQVSIPMSAFLTMES
jgi:hypothetical protein